MYKNVAPKNKLQRARLDTNVTGDHNIASFLLGANAFSNATDHEMSRITTDAHDTPTTLEESKVAAKMESPRRDPSRPRAKQQDQNNDVPQRIERYRRRCDRRVHTRTARATDPQRAPRRSQGRRPPRLSQRRKPTKTWIDRVDEGYWCPWWDFEPFWDWWISTGCDCCGWFNDHRNDEEDNDDIPKTTTFSPSFCQPYQSNLPRVTVHVEAVAIGFAEQISVCNDESSSEEASAPPACTALSWVGFIPKDPMSPITLPCKYSVEGTRVASRMNLPGPLVSATHTISLQQLWVVPRDLDGADLAMVLAYDVPALDQLFYGTPPHHRYSLTALRGQSILLRSVLWTPALGAVVRAAVRAGARHIYVVLSSSTDAPVLPIRMLRHVTLWQENVDPWRPQVEGRIHRLLDYQAAGPDAAGVDLQWMLPVLDPDKGRYIACAPHTMGEEQPPAAEGKWRKDWLSFLRPTPKHVVQFYADDRDDVSRQRDIQFLLSLLSTRALRPAVDAFVTRLPSATTTRALLLEPWNTTEGPERH